MGQSWIILLILNVVTGPYSHIRKLDEVGDVLEFIIMKIG